MKANEVVKTAMTISGTSLSELSEYADCGSKSNIVQLLSRQDMKVGTLAKLLEVMGFRIIVRNTEGQEEFLID